MIEDGIMKKLGVIIVVLALIIGCAGCSCTTAREEEKKTDGIGSPWEYDVSAKDVEKLVGKEFVVPANATDVHYGIMKDGKMAEMSFTIDGVQYVNRMKLDKGYEDISGLYYEWDTIGNVSLNNIEFTTRQCTSDHIANALWYDGKYMNSLFTAGGDKINYDLVPLIKTLLGITDNEGQMSAYQ